MAASLISESSSEQPPPRRVVAVAPSVRSRAGGEGAAAGEEEGLPRAKGRRDPPVCRLREPRRGCPRSRASSTVRARSTAPRAPKTPRVHTKPPRRLEGSGSRAGDIPVPPPPRSRRPPGSGARRGAAGATSAELEEGGERTIQGNSTHGGRGRGRGAVPRRVAARDAPRPGRAKRGDARGSCRRRAEKRPREPWSARDPARRRRHPPYPPHADRKPHVDTSRPGRRSAVREQLRASPSTPPRPGSSWEALRSGVPGQEKKNPRVMFPEGFPRVSTSNSFESFKEVGPERVTDLSRDILFVCDGARRKIQCPSLSLR
ncbi:serine/arginine-rich splicing factor SR45-like [Choloepus didactylus]|uniref:serine/arginine-rich splicing factor SR45-like n=1 Tax=Choloepus didactylus TaxID=27675 RepID=UPI00189CC7AE|nr:serine/arginine-rich splicing factor SR45-like [Choloepus didactylus]